jgi:UDP-4-amino-4-deoxy-L-arabinose-oxoglutarate aminotransferase
MIAVLLALEIGPGDEVIVPAMTFIATANVVELVGAKPVFVDVLQDTLLMDPEGVGAAVTPRTKAVIPVHLYGQMLDVAALREIVGEDIAIIEDCAHCFEGTFRGERPGAHSDAAVFSFYATKNVTCGEGGAVISSSDSLMDRIRQTVLHGMSAGAADRFKKGMYRHWDMQRLGTKANLPDLLAALLPAQIDTVQDMLIERERIANRYEEAFASLPVRLQKIGDDAVTARHLFTIHVPPAKRDAAIHELNANGIGTTVNYRAVHRMTYYKEKYGYEPDAYPHADEWGEGTISIPLYPGLETAAQDHVIDIIKEKVAPLVGG